MPDNDNSLTTVGFYLRSLRAIFNIAIDERIISSDDYPFGRRKYVIPGGSNIKKALKKEELKKIIKYYPETESESRYRNY
jgi:integrase/recombinase XerD